MKDEDKGQDLVRKVRRQRQEQERGSAKEEQSKSMKRSMCEMSNYN